MFSVTDGLAAGCLVLLLLCLASLHQLQRRSAALSRVEGKLDLLLAQAGLEYEPLPGVSGDIADALRRGDKILAIKHYRAATGAGLKDAKDHIQELERRGGV